MAVHINEVVIRAIITHDDDKGAMGKATAAGAAQPGDSQEKMDLLDLVEECIKKQKER